MVGGTTLHYPEHPVLVGILGGVRDVTGLSGKKIKNHTEDPGLQGLS